MTDTSQLALIVQGDHSLLLDVHNPGFDVARAEISPFAELIKSPEHIHTYRMTLLSLWNAASAGISEEEIVESLNRLSRFPVPENVLYFVHSTLSRYGLIKVDATEDEEVLFLKSTDMSILTEIAHLKSLKRYLTPGEGGFFMKLMDRGSVKLNLIRAGFPVEDLAPLKSGDPCPINMRKTMLSGKELVIRDYQEDAIKAFIGNNKPGTGFGTVVVPCGGGKTVIGMCAMSRVQAKTLILTTNIAAVHQWRRELIDKTDLRAEDIGEYTGEKKEIKPVTIGTYQILIWRKDKESEYTHFSLFRKGNWGLIIYDEVHLLPAPVFRVTAEIQAVRRLGLTATLVREDGAEEDVFSLVGPKRYDVPWKELEAGGWIATAWCHEVRLDLPDDLKTSYAVADKRLKFRIAAENPHKSHLVLDLIEKHPDDAIMIIGQYVKQLQEMARILKAPLITGKTPNALREEIYDDFRTGKSRIIVVSKVANFAIDLPDASVAIQISGTFGSRQEEAQRLGRILRPKEKDSWFYSLVTRYTVEEQYAANRQQFLTEQGYKYTISLGMEDL
ncbi:DNA repair helicase XPB [Oceanispirochaeta sp.]|jgi:DNA excision repair protein ERCC-3|uniref:DNA repair helicase XPB n=1 Tax=Oceanispirochaeta sp. TaxID=2035350 RepID=UPI002604F394|nr:DNA repair helicase XPB [Oceanispirochaeta sp.]MDA3957415.1 DEAD/DEAH box helicase [Oceanispirochaeta sp.]